MLRLVTVDIDTFQIPPTWHNDTEEGIRFSINAAFGDKVDIDTVVILDMTENGGLETIEKILAKIV